MKNFSYKEKTAILNVGNITLVKFFKNKDLTLSIEKGKPQLTFWDFYNKKNIVLNLKENVEIDITKYQPQLISFNSHDN